MRGLTGIIRLISKVMNGFVKSESFFSLLLMSKRGRNGMTVGLSAHYSHSSPGHENNASVDIFEVMAVAGVLSKTPRLSFVYIPIRNLVDGSQLPRR